MKDIYYDLYRYTGKTGTFILIKTILSNRVFRKIFYHRVINEQRGFVSLIIKVLRKINASKVSIDMPTSVQLGKGALFIHPYSIAINSKARIGSNVTILHGVTIGLVKSGARAGVPVIGDNVYLGANSTVVGGVRIGSNVLISANAFVDFDVSDNSIVLGNPGVIHRKEKASEIYLNNSIENLGGGRTYDSQIDKSFP